MNSTMKSALLGSASFALMLAASGPANAQNPMWDGFYAGVQGGYHGINARTTEEGTARIFNSFSSNGEAFGLTQSSNRRSLTGAFGGLFAGYGMTMGRFYVGGELDFIYSSAKNKQSTNFALTEGCGGGGCGGFAQLNTTIRAKESYGGSLRLGYLVSPGALLYTRFGFQRGTYNVKSSTFVEGLGTQRTVSTINQSKGFNGFRFGLGADLSLAGMFPTAGLGNTFLRLDWSATWYQRKSFFGSNARDIGGSRTVVANHAIEVKPFENRFSVGLGIKF